MTALPPGVKTGYVIFASKTVVADTVDDADRYPDAIPSIGMTVEFTPVTRHMIVPDVPGLPSILTYIEAQGGTINGDGVMVDTVGLPGVWVVAGVYDVAITPKSGPRFDVRIEVTDAHTEVDPLDLAVYVPQPSPVDPLPGVPLVGLTVTQAQYDALPGYDPQTVYFVIGAA